MKPFVELYNDVPKIIIKENEEVQWKVVVTSFPHSASIKYIFKGKLVQMDTRVSLMLVVYISIRDNEYIFVLLLLLKQTALAYHNMTSYINPCNMPDSNTEGHFMKEPE